MKIKDDVYIVTLQVLKKDLVEGMSFSDLQAALKKRGFDLEGNANLKKKVNNILKQYCRTQYEAVEGVKVNRGKAAKYHLLPEGYFYLLEYIELKEARASSKSALGRSTWAIIISAILAVFSIFISIQQLNSPSTLNEKQFSVINDINDKFTNLYSPTRQEWLEVVIAKYVRGFNDFDTSIVVHNDNSINIGIYFNVNNQSKEDALKFKARIEEEVPLLIKKYDWISKLNLLVNVYGENRK